MNYDASIIIPTFNRYEELQLTIDSLLKQKCSYSFEIIISDDGSSDKTKHLIDQYKGDIDIKYVYQQDRGYRCAKARNNGIKISEGDVCVFIDSGVVLSSEAINKHIHLHKSERSPCLLAGYTCGNYPLNIDEVNCIRECLHSLTIDDAIKEVKKKGIRDSRDRMLAMYGDNLSIWPAPWVVIYGCNLSIKKNYAIDIGMFDENFQSWGADDNEFGLRAQWNGAKLIMNREIMSVYYPHHSGNKANDDIESFNYNLDRNKKYIYSKFPLKSVKLWIDHKPHFEVNKLMLEQGDMQERRQEER